VARFQGQFYRFQKLRIAMNTEIAQINSHKNRTEIQRL
jgi:hypothetical protein